MLSVEIAINLILQQFRRCTFVLTERADKFFRVSRGQKEVSARDMRLSLGQSESCINKMQMA